MIRKPFRHSRRFERTQTGCLTCRHKKKKCDGVKPVCDSCSKRGLECKFPENIRIFNAGSFQMTTFKVEPLRLTTKGKKSYRSPNKTMIASKRQKSSSPTYSIQSIPSVESITSVPSDEEPMYDDSEPEELDQNEINFAKLAQTIKENNRTTEIAISLSTNGESIKRILDNAAIGVMKRSIETLQFINWEKKTHKAIDAQLSHVRMDWTGADERHHGHNITVENDNTLNTWVIMQGLKFGAEPDMHSWLEEDFLTY